MKGTVTKPSETGMPDTQLPDAELPEPGQSGPSLSERLGLPEPAPTSASSPQSSSPQSSSLQSSDEGQPRATPRPTPTPSSSAEATPAGQAPTTESPSQQPLPAQPPYPADPPASRPRKVRLRRTRRVLRHPITRGLIGLLVVLLIWLSWSIGGALTRPGKDSTSARLAESARDHHMNSLVNRLEKYQYDMNKPKVGGTAPKIPKAVAQSPTVAPAPEVTVPPHSAAPPPVQLPAGIVPKPGEGQWQSVVFSGDLPAVRLTYVRPDDQHTSYLAAIMWLDPKLLSATLHPGIQDPGGSWQVPSSISAQEQPTAAAAFPGGFRLTGATGSRGGWYTEGKEVTPLRDGAASLVIDKGGAVTIGSWNRDVRMSPSVASVRQNLDLLVDNGQLDASCSDNNSPKWGWTLGNVAYVPRTAIGERADGSLVFVNSPATSVCSIGRLLQAAGAQRGMELDINPEWSIGYYYTHEGGKAVGHPVRLDQGKAGDWYFSTQSRDFFSFSLRPSS